MSHNEKDNFLLFFPVTEENYCKHFCCGCSLKCGIQFISIISIINGVFGIIDSFYSKNFLSLILVAFLALCSLLGGSYLFSSVGSYREDFAMRGYFFYLINFYVDLISFLIGMILIMAFHTDIEHMGKISHAWFFFIYLLVAVFYFLIRIYFLYVIFSYCMYVKSKSYGIIENNTAHVVAQDVRNI
jgi:hypothetical protein